MQSDLGSRGPRPKFNGSTDQPWLQPLSRRRHGQCYFRTTENSGSYTGTRDLPVGCVRRVARPPGALFRLRGARRDIHFSRHVHPRVRARRAPPTGLSLPLNNYPNAESASDPRHARGSARRSDHTREVGTFGSPLIVQNANREMFEEGVEVLFKAFEGKPFSHHGKYYTIPPEVPYRGYTLKEITLIPAPERLPVECWQPIQSGSERAFEFMAKYGISGVIGGGSAEGGAVERHMIGFQQAYAKRGVKLELGERLALGYQFHIANSREQAIREAAPHYEENMKMFGELRLVRALTDEQIAAMRDPKLIGTVKLPTIEDAVKAGGFLAGRPEDIIEQLKAVEKRYPGLDRVICATPLGTPLDVQLADLDRFAKEVIPAFRSTAAPTRVAAE